MSEKIRFQQLLKGRAWEWVLMIMFTIHEQNKHINYFIFFIFLLCFIAEGNATPSAFADAYK